MRHNQMMGAMAAAAVLFLVLALFGVPAARFYPLLLLACPLMMIFMMSGMRGHDDDRTEEKQLDR